MALQEFNTRFSRWQRARALSGDGRTGVYAKSTVRQKQSAHLRLNWVPHLAFTVVAFAAAWLVSLTVAQPYLQGLIVGIGFTTAVAVQWLWVVQVTGTAGLAMGEQAERFTAAMLRKRRGWTVVNHVNLRQSDIDHVLLGPDGIFAIETKWSSQEWSHDRLERAAAQAARNARDLSLWGPLRAFGPVQPLVVLWGPGAAEMPAATTVNRVDVVPGRDFEQWWQQRPVRQPALSSADLACAWDALSQRCEVMDPNQPVKPRAADELTLWVTISVTMGVVAVAAAFWALNYLSLTAAIAAGAVSATLGLIAHRRLNGYGRWLATGWVTGIAGAYGLAVLAVFGGSV